eukprot:g1152.t1
MTLDELARTGAGKAVGKLRKGGSTERVREAAKALVAKWKALAAAGAPTKRKAPEAAAAGNAPSAKKAKPEPDSIGMRGEDDKLEAHTEHRIKAVVMLEGRFAPNVKAAEGGADTAAGAVAQRAAQRAKGLATAIEGELHALAGGDDPDMYKKKIRQLAVNLKRNDALRAAVFGGALLVSKLCRMTPEQLASREAQKLAAQMRHDKAESARSDWDEANYDKVNKAIGLKPEDSLFRCERCKSAKTQSVQVQTRSADEPMTVFVTCMDCGYKWKC